jgi:hypothetical protein
MAKKAPKAEQASGQTYVEPTHNGFAGESFATTQPAQAEQKKEADALPDLHSEQGGGESAASD